VQPDPGTSGTSPVTTRWASVRAAVRGAIAARHGDEIARALLPTAPNEPALAIDPALARSFVELAEQYPRHLADEHRKQHGAWFTPLELAQPTADRALALLEAHRATPLRVVDPAVGGGTFLRAAFRTLRANGLPADQALASLHGVDVDATAAALAALAVWEEAGCLGDPREVAARIRTGDGLLDLADGSFDAVLTNPPWETLQATPTAAAYVATLRRHFQHQGRGKLYTYRLFVERSLRLLHERGVVGMIVPASLWFDRDAEPVRRLLLDGADWQWLFGFENRRKVFAIDGRYRFGAIVAQRPGPTTHARVAFGRTELADWRSATPPHTRVAVAELRALSPGSGTFVEADEPRDLELLLRMQRSGTPLCGPRGRFGWRQGDWNMTSDRRHFVLRDDAERQGYRPDGDGIWRCADRPDLLPLLQGAMIGDLHPNVGAHARGTGHGTQWELPPTPDTVRPAFLVRADAWRAKTAARAPFRLVHRALGNASNERTMLACLLPDVPCGNSLGVLTPWPTVTVQRAPLRELAAAAAVLGSLPFDWALRQRLAGTNLNQFVLADCVLPELDVDAERELAGLALRLCALLPGHATLWRAAAAEGWCPDEGPAVDATIRASLVEQLDVRVGRSFGLDEADVAWITRDCERPAAALRRVPAGALTKGFWRVDRGLPPELRPPEPLARGGADRW
jgi:hypothetical protein